MGILWERDRHVIRNAGHRDATVVPADLAKFIGTDKQLEAAEKDRLTQELTTKARPREIRIHVTSKSPFEYVLLNAPPGAKIPVNWWEID